MPTILINDGNGFFVSETLERLPEDASSTRAISVGDLDLDGDLDFVTANSNAEQNGIFLNDGAGKFTEANNRLPSLADTSSDVDLVDIDLDGDLDIVFANSDIRIIAPGAPAAPIPALNVVYLNKGLGKASFKKATQRFLPPIIETSFEIEFGDVNGDGFDDIFVSNANGGDENLLVRDKLPRKAYFGDLVPILESVTRNDDGTSTAVFGYKNKRKKTLFSEHNVKNIVIGVGNSNASPVIYRPGRVREAFSVTFEYAVSWTLFGRTVIAKAK